MDSGEIPAKYEVLKEADNTNYALLSQMQFELQDGLHLAAFVTEEQMGVVAEEYNNYYGMDDFSYRRLVAAAGLGDGATYVFPEWANAGYGSFSQYADASEIISLVAGKTQAADDEVIVSTQLFLAKRN